MKNILIDLILFVIHETKQKYEFIIGMIIGISIGILL